MSLEDFDDELPAEELGEWEEITNPTDGSLYYHNRVTRVTQWDPPLWVDSVDAVSGRPFWFNAHTRQTVWERPHDFVPIIREARVEVPPGDIVDHAGGGGGAGEHAPSAAVAADADARVGGLVQPEEDYDDDFEDAAGEHVEAIVGHRMKGGHRQYMVRRSACGSGDGGARAHVRRCTGSGRPRKTTSGSTDVTWLLVRGGRGL